MSTRRVLLNDQRVTIIGVMAPGFSGLSLDTDIWVPSMMIGLTSSASLLETRGNRWLAALARVKDGVALDVAQADLDAAAAAMEAEFPDTNTDRGAQLQMLEAFYLGDTAGTLRLLFGAVLLLLLVACSNVAALQLARSTSRQHEISVSLALGATRKHVARQLAHQFARGAFDDWDASMTGHIAFGLPASLLLFGLSLYALRRTRDDWGIVDEDTITAKADQGSAAASAGAVPPKIAVEADGRAQQDVEVACHGNCFRLLDGLDAERRRFRGGRSCGGGYSGGRASAGRRRPEARPPTRISAWTSCRPRDP